MNHCASVGQARGNQLGGPRLFTAQLEGSGEESRNDVYANDGEVHSVIGA